MKQKNKKIKICLAGNPNCGKSSLFNNLTGLKQHVGNYPGVTVEKKEGTLIKDNYEITITDLPGIYSLSASSEDEIVARNFIIEEKPDLIIDVVDSSNLERNLYLYAQLSELGIPVIAAMNMTDILQNKGQKIDYNKLLEKYNIIAAPIIASKNIGTEELIKKAIDVYEKKIKIKNTDIDYGADIPAELNKIQNCIYQDLNLTTKYPVKYFSISLLKQEKYVLNKIKKSPYCKQIQKQSSQSNKYICDKFQENIETVIADKIYTWISSVCSDTLQTVAKSKYNISEAIDKIVLNKIFSIPIFALVMYIIFKFTFTLSEPVVGWFETAIEYLGQFAANIIPEGMLQSLVVDGIIGGVGGVLSFFPLILFMFFAIAFFEDTGYMARAVFIMDRFMKKFGLHGKSFASMIIATNGCAVPAMMATRTIDNKKDRLITLMVTPFMICGAKLPIFALFIGAFFTAKQGANVMFIMYLISVVLALGSAWVLKKTILRSEPTYFLMELPPYRKPSLKNITLKMWERGWMYIRKAGTIILLMSVLIWAGLTFPSPDESEISALSKEKAAIIQTTEQLPELTQTVDVSGEEVSANVQTQEETSVLSKNEIASYQMEHSYIGRLGNFIEPVISPIGFDGKTGIALIAGLAAKEVVVSTLGTIYSLGEVDVEDAGNLAKKIAKDPNWNKLKAVTFLIFCLIYLPCIVAVAVFYRETGSKIKWLLFLIFWTTVMGWSISFIVYQAGKLLCFGD